MSITNLIVSIFLATLGAIIRFGKASWLIAGYNTSSKEEKDRYDEKALCKYTGNFIFILAGIIFFMAIWGLFKLPNLNVVIAVGWIVFVVVIIAGVIFMNTGNKLKKH